MSKPKRKPFIPVCSCEDFSNCDHYNFPESPQHDRTSCSDDHPINACADGTGCVRCNAIAFRVAAIRARELQHKTKHLAEVEENRERLFKLVKLLLTEQHRLYFAKVDGVLDDVTKSNLKAFEYAYSVEISELSRLDLIKKREDDGIWYRTVIGIMFSLHPH